MLPFLYCVLTDDRFISNKSFPARGLQQEAVAMVRRMAAMIDRGTCINVLCFIAILVLTGLVLPSAAEDVLLAAQQPFDLVEGTTLVVEDVDPQQGVVWLGIYSENEALDSAVLHLGEHFNCCEMDLAVTRIYAGGEGDLISLEINGGDAMGISGPLASESESAFDEHLKKSPGFGAALPAVSLLGYLLIKSFS